MPCTCHGAKQQISRSACNTVNEMLRMLRNRPASCSLSRSVCMQDADSAGWEHTSCNSAEEP